MPTCSKAYARPAGGTSEHVGGRSRVKAQCLMAPRGRSPARGRGRQPHLSEQAGEGRELSGAGDHKAPRSPWSSCSENGQDNCR